ncbi:hypothetical protein YC2023_077195 [Brassica napus]
MEDNSRRICSLELRFSTEDTLLLVNSLSRKEHNLQSKGAQGIAYMAHVFQNLPATFYKPLESGMQGAYAMHLFYRKLWLTALWMWNSCLSEIYQNCSLLLWRNGFAEAYGTDGVGMLLQEREVVYKLDLKTTDVGMLEQVSSEQMLQSQVKKNKGRESL